MKRQNVVFEEYMKYIFPRFDGKGGAVHRIKASCENPKTAFIRHSFGSDECLNEFVSLGSIIDANRLFKSKAKYMNNNEYSFGINSGYAAKGGVILNEISSGGNAKIFEVDWRRSFGERKKTQYFWGWNSNVMFSSPGINMKQQSALKINYPTDHLTFEIHFSEMYPLKDSPYVVRINKEKEEVKVAEAIKSEHIKKLLISQVKYKEISKVFTVKISNPILRCEYRMVWEIDFDKLGKYLLWLESHM